MTFQNQFGILDVSRDLGYASGAGWSQYMFSFKSQSTSGVEEDAAVKQRITK